MILDQLNVFMLDLITQERDLFIDELIMLWHQCLVFWEYIKISDTTLEPSSTGCAPTMGLF